MVLLLINCHLLKKRNRLNVKVSNLSDGIYIMRITTNKDIQKVKVIIKRYLSLRFF